jgi:predicted RNA-binding Zn-ribbon protein involved in translation (DUF1610 family)
MPDEVRLAVIDTPDSVEDRTVMRRNQSDPDFLFVKAEATDISFVCGECGRTLLYGIDRGDLVGMVFVCPSCSAHNDAP